MQEDDYLGFYLDLSQVWATHHVDDIIQRQLEPRKHVLRRLTIVGDSFFPTPDSNTALLHHSLRYLIANTTIDAGSFQGLECLSFSSLYIDSLGAKYLQKLCHQLYPQLQDLSFEGTIFSNESFQKFVFPSNVQDEISSIESVILLKIPNVAFYGCQIEDDQVACLGNAFELSTCPTTTTTITRIQNLCLAENHIQSNGAKQFLHGLRSNMSLKQLDLSYNTGIGGAGIPHNLTINSLEELKLYHVGLNSQGIEYLATALQQNSSLTVLNLGFNPIGDEGVELLSNILNKTMLQELHLRHVCVTTKGIIALATALQINTTITKLVLSHNSIGDEGVHYIASALLTDETTLQELDLTSVEMSNDGILYLSTALEMNKRLKILKIVNNYQISDMGIESLKDCLQDYNKYLIRVDFNERNNHDPILVKTIHFYLDLNKTNLRFQLANAYTLPITKVLDLLVEYTSNASYVNTIIHACPQVCLYFAR